MYRPAARLAYYETLPPRVCTSTALVQTPAQAALAPQGPQLACHPFVASEPSFPRPRGLNLRYAALTSGTSTAVRGRLVPAYTLRYVWGEERVLRLLNNPRPYDSRAQIQRRCTSMLSLRPAKLRLRGLRKRRLDAATWLTSLLRYKGSSALQSSEPNL